MDGTDVTVKIFIHIQKIKIKSGLWYFLICKIRLRVHRTTLASCEKTI